MCEGCHFLNLFPPAPSGPPEVSKVTTLTHLGISCRSLSNALLTFLEGRILVRVKFFSKSEATGREWRTGHASSLLGLIISGGQGRRMKLSCGRVGKRCPRKLKAGRGTGEGSDELQEKCLDGGAGRRFSPCLPPPHRSLPVLFDSPHPRASVSPL